MFGKTIELSKHLENLKHSLFLSGFCLFQPLLSTEGGVSIAFDRGRKQTT